MIENLDTNVGRLLDALQRSGKIDNTLVIFTSDNGGLATSEGSPTCNAPLAEGKGWMYDGGLRIPLIINWPGVVEPSVVLQLVISPDFYPTLVEAGGATMPPHATDIDGVSLMPLLTDDPVAGRALFWYYPHYANQGGTPGAAVRDGDWKLVRFFEDNHLELYNLTEDVSEAHDLAAENPGTAQRLNTALTNWLATVEARIPKANPIVANDDLPG